MTPLWVANAGVWLLNAHLCVRLGYRWQPYACVVVSAVCVVAAVVLP